MNDISRGLLTSGAFQRLVEMALPAHAWPGGQTVDGAQDAIVLGDFVGV